MSPFAAYVFFVCIYIITVTYGSDAQCIDNLIGWISKNGGQISPSIEIKSDDIRSRGVYISSSTNPLKSDDELASIPLSLLFTLENAQKLLNNIIPQNKKETLTKLGPVDTLAFALIIEYQNEDSFWKPYLQCLPTMEQIKDELQMPLYWTPQEARKYLQASRISSFIMRRLRSIQSSFKDIESILQSISYMKDIVDFTMDRWIWALSIIWSRSFSVMIEHKKMKCLVPFGDLFNFNNELNEINIDPSAWNQSNFAMDAMARDLMQYDVKSFTSSNGQNFVFKIRNDAHQKYESGMQLYAEYAYEIQPNFVVFLDYGFTIKDNPMDGIWITIEDLLTSSKFMEKFKNQKIKSKAQQLMKELIDSLQLSRVFVTRSMVSEHYMDTKDVSMEKQKRFIEPYAYSLWLMSMVLNCKNDIGLFANDLKDFRTKYPQIKSNQEIIAVVIHIIKTKSSDKKAAKIVKNSWNMINNMIKSEMSAFDTSLIQDLMLREEMEESGEMDSKLECGLNIRIDDKYVLFSVWVQLQRLRELLLTLLK